MLGDVLSLADVDNRLDIEVGGDKLSRADISQGDKGAGEQRGYSF